MEHTTPPGPRGVLGIFWKLQPTGDGPASREPPCLDCPLGCRGLLMGTQAHFTDEEARPRGARARQGAGPGRGRGRARARQGAGQRSEPRRTA